MRIRTNYLIFSFALMGICLIFTSGCDKFNINSKVQIPVISTVAVSDISGTTARSGGNITSDGGGELTARGVCWSTTPNPTIYNLKTTNGSGMGSFVSEITRLMIGTTYYVRAYAINSGGTGYGKAISFTTISVPVITTEDISDITKTTARSGGNITSDGGAPISVRGVCWSIRQTPTITDSKTTDGRGAGSFISNITGLSANRYYYVRAFATNAIGTTYGNEVSFKTNNTLTDIDGNTYSTVTIGTQEWMAENLKVTKYPGGAAIPLVTNNTSWANLGDNNTDDAYSYYNNESTSQYGALYTYAAAKDACPTNWHLPSDAEWTVLENYLADNGYNYDGTTGGGRNKIAKALATTTNWRSSTTTGAIGNNLSLNNISSFSALPGGYRASSPGFFDHGGHSGHWWSSTESISSGAYDRTLSYYKAYVGRSDIYKSNGCSVRCVRD